MKKSLKILFAILALALISSVVGIFAIAASSDGEASGMTYKSDDPDGYMYQIFTPSNGKITKYKSLDHFKTNFTDAESGAVITLLSNITIANTLPAQSNKTAYLDLNGYTMYLPLATNTAMTITSGAKLYVYSSDNDYTARIIVSRYQDGVENTVTLFRMQQDNSYLQVGAFNGNAPVITPSEDGTTATVSMTGTYNGKIETHASALFSSSKSADDKNPVNSSACFDGITHYQTNVKEGHPMIIILSSPDVTVKNSTIVSTTGGSVIQTTYKPGVHSTTGQPKAPCDSNITMESCQFYTSGAALVEAYESPEAIPELGIKKSEMIFKDCDFACGTVLEETENSGKPSYINCNFTSSVAPKTEELLIKTQISGGEFSLTSIKFDYSSGSLNESNPYTVTTSKESLTFLYTTDESIPHATVTWVGLNGAVKEEGFDTRLGFMPSAPTTQNFLTRTSEAYAYRYTPEFSPVTEDVTYTLVPTASFSIKTNLTLYADFVYNIYLPKNVGDSEYVNSVSLGGYTVNLEDTVKVDGKEYYLIKRNISALNGDESFDFTVNISTSNETFDKTWTLSIPDYVERVNKGNYSDYAKNMVNSAMTYIKAARNFANGSDIYTIEGLTHVSGAKAAKFPDEFYGMNLGIGDEIKFKFYIYDDVLESKNIYFTYPVNNVNETVLLTKDDVIATSYTEDGRTVSYYPVALKAYDLRDKISIRFDDSEKATPDYTYSLANYVYFANTETGSNSNHDALVTLMDALWAHSADSENYVRNATSDSPEVEITVDGNPLNAIVASTEEEIEAASKLAAEIYAVTGKQLEIVSEDTADGNIIITVTEPSLNYDCTVTVDNGDLVMLCGYKSYVANAASYFAAAHIAPLNKNYDFKNYFSDNYYADRIYYSDFGAKADGTTDDFFAIKATHDFANISKRHTVCADSGRTYYIKDTVKDGATQVVDIKTNVDWADAKFIIDDSQLSPLTDSAIYGKNLFNVTSDYKADTISKADILQGILEDGLGKGTTRINLGLDYPAMLIPYNSNHKVYRRRGYGSWAGNSMHEVIVIDKNGFVDESTPVMWDYNGLDKIDVYRLDIEPITIEGGEFTTIASDISCYNKETGEFKESYFNRGIDVMRSYTTVKNVKHYVTGEISLERQKNGEIGAPYHGFFSSSSANEVTFDGCVLSAKRCYTKGVGNTLSGGTMGTYGISATAVNKVTFINCKQANFWIKVDLEAGTIEAVEEGTPGAVSSMAKNDYDKKSVRYCWGLGGTNYCKNMSFINSTLSRFDAHCGLYNGQIINSTVNAISITGNGDILIKDSRSMGEDFGASSNVAVSLRADYGYTWEGTVTIENFDLYVYAEGDNMSDFGVINHGYSNWYYGYACHFPNLAIDNLRFHDYAKFINGDKDTLLSKDAEIPLIAPHDADLTTEPNLHLEVTENRSPIYPYVDADGDKLVDGTQIPYDGEERRGGVTDESSKKNLNIVVPPEFIEVKNNPHGDYIIPFDVTTFFDNTRIVINGEIINEGRKIKENDSPITEYN